MDGPPERTTQTFSDAVMELRKAIGKFRDQLSDLALEPEEQKSGWVKKITEKLPGFNVWFLIGWMAGATIATIVLLLATRRVVP